MKIFIIQQVIPNYRIPLFNRLNAMSEYDVTLIVATNPEPMAGVKIITDKTQFKFKVIWLKQKKIFNRFFYFPQLPRYLRQEKPQTIITQSMYYPGLLATIYQWLLIKTKKIKIVYWTIPQFPVRRKFSWLKALAFSFIDAFLIYGEHGIPILKSYNIKRKKIFVAYNSLDTEAIFKIQKGLERQNLLPPKYSQRLVFMGRLIPEKKVDLLLNAFAVIKQTLPQAELIIVGDGPENTKLQQLAVELGLFGKIQFIGHIASNQQKAKILLSSGLFVLPGMGGLAINEAMAYGLPIICATADGTEKQLVYNGVNGYIYQDDNIHDLVSKIKKIITNPTRQQKMSVNSKRIIKEKVNLNTMIQGITQAIIFVNKQ